MCLGMVLYLENVRRGGRLNPGVSSRGFGEPPESLVYAEPNLCACLGTAAKGDLPGVYLLWLWSGAQTYPTKWVNQWWSSIAELCTSVGP